MKVVIVRAGDNVSNRGKRKGKERKGKERKGKERKGKERKGKERKDLLKERLRTHSKDLLSISTKVALKFVENTIVFVKITQFSIYLLKKS